MFLFFLEFTKMCEFIRLGDVFAIWYGFGNINYDLEAADDGPKL